MLVDQVVTYLEMTSAQQLRPSRPAGIAVAFDRVGPDLASLVRTTHGRIGTPHHWSNVGRSGWECAALQRRPGSRAWVVRADGAVAGLVVLDAQPEANVEVTVFGLVPEMVGRGMGGPVLTRAVELAWNGVDPFDLAPTRRVWLHTSSLDHLHALPNYRARGFRPFWTRTNRHAIT